MRRLELLIKEVRRITDNEDPTGIEDRELVQYFNDAQDRIRSRITASYPDVFTNESLISTVKDQESYALPSDIYMGTRLISVDWKYGVLDNDYCKLRATGINRRFTSTTSENPLHYIRLDDDILINPLPSSAKTDGLRVVYHRKLRDLDIRRGEISSVSKTGSTLDTITLDLTPTLNKNAGVVQAGADVLDVIDYICVVDRDGSTVLNSIPIDTYDSATGVITVTAAFTTTVDEADFAGEFVVGGKVASTHSELKDLCERYLISYVLQKVLRRDSNEAEAQDQVAELTALERDIVKLYQDPDEDIMDIPIDIDWW